MQAATFEKQCVKHLEVEVSPVAYGVGRTARLEVSACHRETVRLIEVHNKQMSTGKLGGN